MPRYVKEFVLTHVVKDVSKLKEDEYSHGVGEEHFGLFGACERVVDRSRKKFKLISVTGQTLEKTATRCYRNDERSGFGPSKFIKWEDLIKYYIVDDKATFQIHVKIIKMRGIEKKKLRNFDESMKQFSDVVLIVENKKFYVSKLFLAGQSSYFEALFLRNFSESEQSEIKLSDIDSKDFQNFLELLHGESAIDDTTVDGILKLSDMYDAKTAINKCQEFLVNESDKTLKEKLELSIRYKFENLKNNCLLKIKTIDDIKSDLPGDLNELGLPVATAIIQKLISLQ